jgi:acyl-coenzyme A synthetase/AMP-(fatty) acid ligase
MLSETDVQLHVREQAAAFKSPHRVLFVAREDVPRTASGKVARPRLKEQAADAFGVAF